MRKIVIHPNDQSTQFLRELYDDVTDIVLTNDNSNSQIIDVLKKLYDADYCVYLLGHGYPYGLYSTTRQHLKDYSFYDEKRFDRIIINSKHVDFLRKCNNVVGIFCYAHLFAEKYKLKGLFTNMIFSETDETRSFGLDGYTQQDLDMYMKSWTKDLKFCLDNYKLSEIPDKMKELCPYPDDYVCRWNYESIYYYE